ncbi:putative ATP-dependent RNA helicase ucp12 [Coniosporium apollinis]|uniref:ATP-dependent RNA helicase ucp12 n=1 Tax=Coniosporium apollinis TaxID=61459 RepID=A0ABQ9NU88_9PEZI|nr:putative ATP-dependent RNA helicase ucp12 [Coniosporium apollinis]
MPSKPHAPRAGSKKPAPPPADGEDTSFIVFSNAKDEPKKGKGGKTASGNTTSDEKSKAKGKEPAVPAEDAPKKPDTRTLIGGASWTGKLPVNMLSEHCQKLKWDKPEYTMHKTPEGFISNVILRTVNPKTKETLTLPPFKVPPQLKSVAAQPTAVEARHFAATYALFRVCNMRNIHMMMPPTYRDLWKGEFQDIKKQDVAAGMGWMYEADPFVAQKEREDALANAEKKRQAAAAQREAEKNAGSVGPGATHLSGGSGNRMKGWTRVPKVEMGKRTRTQVERMIRAHAVWNPHHVHLSHAQKSRIIDEVTGLGFRRSHVEEAADICKDREEVLEWLLIHVPEDDLPQWCLPEGYTAGISMASHDLKRQAAIQRLAAAGYALELCEETLDSCNGDEGKAASLLQARLLEGTPVHGVDGAQEASADRVDPWKEEQDVLTAIYGERLKITSDACQIELEIAPPTDKTFTLHMRKPSGLYPHVLPIMAVHAPIPAYIRLSIIKRALVYAQENFLGEQMIFNLVDWLEHEIPGILENPGRLSEVAAAVAAADANAKTGNSRQKGRRNRYLKLVSWRPGTDTSNRMLREWQAKQTMPAQQQMMHVRESLPAWKLQEAIVNAVNNHQVTIISGETGSGKSTQSVQFILDDLIQRLLGEAANIVCTQPRRISALGLADRVAEERCSRVGEEVGYSIRGESRHKPGVTKISFVTTGVLLRRLQTSGGSAEDVVASLADVSHVVVDEVHERSLDTDFLLVLLRDVLKARRDLKVILMSATLDADVFAAYFNSVGPVGRIEIQGRTHPVEDFYMDDVVRMTGFGGRGATDPDEDESGWDEGPAPTSMAGKLRSVGMRINYDLIAQTVRHIDAELGSQDGGILIFLPGTMEIDRTLQALRNIPNIYALPLHASLLPAEQRRVFPPAPKGMRKVIASTNVAETSITIEDIVAVIDTGRVKETSFDPQNNMVKLEEVWASRAACKQRRGRAGRVRAGKCYKLYTRNAEMKMAERPEPEIRRVPLEQLCLSVKAMGVKNVAAFLAGALTPPESLAVEGAIELLGRMGAIDGEEMTALGRHLATIPADLRCGKLLIYGATFGCLEACLTIASILTVRSPFVSPQAKREESKAARSSFGAGQGDLIADLTAYTEWSALRSKGASRHELRAWCEQNFLSTQTLQDISTNRAQYLSSLKETGFLPLTYTTPTPSSTPTSYNRHNTSTPLIRALVAGAFNPQIARIELPDQKFAASVSGAVALDPEARTIKYFNQDNGRVFVHPSSTLFDAQAFPGGARFMSYFTKMATSKVFIRDVTPFNAYSALLFSGPIGLDTQGRGLVVDGWLRLRGWARIGVLVSRLRMLLDEVLARKIEEPEMDLGGSEVVAVCRRLVELDGLDA